MKLDIKAIVFIIIIALIAVYLQGVTLLFGAIFSIVMYLTIYKLGSPVGSRLLDFDFKMFLAQKKVGSKEAILLREEYKKKHEGIMGALDIAQAITWVTFGLTLLFMKIFMEQIMNVLQGVSNIDAKVVAFVLLAGIIGSLVSPLAVPYWVLQGSRVRIFNKKRIFLLPPGSKVRSLFKAGFGTGNIAIVLYTFWAIMSSAQDLLTGFQIAAGIFIFAFGSLGVGGIIAGSIIAWRNKELFAKALDDYEEKYRNVAMNTDEFLGVIRDATEPAEEKPTGSITVSQEIGEQVEQVEKALEESEEKEEQEEENKEE